MSPSAPANNLEEQLHQQAAWIATLESSAARFQILSTLPFGKVAFWNRVVSTELPRPNRLAALTASLGIPDITLIGRLLRRARQADVVLLAGGERADLIYAAIAGLCPWIQTPHVIVDAHWQKSDGLAGRLQRLLLALAARLLHEVQPHSREEIDLYAEQFGIRKAILRDIPWSSSMIGHEDIARTRDAPGDRSEAYVLTGGHSFRDYPPLLQAAHELNLPVKIGIAQDAQSAAFTALVQRYPKVTVHGNWRNLDYFEQMARCAIFALPIVPGLTRSTADQTLLNAMLLGRLVVASSAIGPRIYVRDGINGFLVKEPTSDAWQAVLQRVLALTDTQRADIARQAELDAKLHFNEHVRLGRTLDNVLAVLDPQHRTSWSHPVDRPDPSGSPVS